MSTRRLVDMVSAAVLMIGLGYVVAVSAHSLPGEDGGDALVDAGFADRVLLSQDVFLKMMLTKFGGFGYAHILRHFVPRLKRHGVEAAVIDRMMVHNPRAVFSAS